MKWKKYEGTVLTSEKTEALYAWIFMNHMVTEKLYWRKIICGCFRFIWLWLLISIMKRCAERYAVLLYRTSLRVSGKLLKYFEKVLQLLTVFEIRYCYVIDFIVHVSSHFLQSTLIVQIFFYFLQFTDHFSDFIYHSPSCSYLPYLVVFILHGNSTLLSVSLFSQSYLWKLTTYECL